MCGWLPRKELPADVKEWRFLELKKEIHKLANTRKRTYTEQVALDKCFAEYERRRKG